MSNIINKTFQYGSVPIKLETGLLARQATSAVTVTAGDTVLLVTVVGIPTKPEAVRDFFPLVVNYQEKHYAAGKTPSGFVKREGRPSVRETLFSRLIDRPIRPLFPDDFVSEVQVVVIVMSMDPEISPEIPALLGASAALAISGMPFNGPLGAAKIGYKNGEFILNPSASSAKDSQLDLVMAGTKDAILMVESEAQELSEDIMLQAVLFGHEQMQIAIEAIADFASQVNQPAWVWQPLAIEENLRKEVVKAAESLLAEAYSTSDKAARKHKLTEIKQAMFEKFLTETDDEIKKHAIQTILGDLEKQVVRHKVLNKRIRIDGRSPDVIRPISIQTGIFPRTHGSANFTRGETQALVVTTLGTEKDAQIIDSPLGESREFFMLHYNFPPFCVGEIGTLTSPKRREIGHGNLARRALNPVMPNLQDFPYSVRVVSEITASNGSSSMASVCGGCLALMDAGVPIKTPVAGIAMGLIKEQDDYAILSDILGDEDHLGDMDFKVAGTINGVTALQMDIKIAGITKEIMEKALAQAKQGRLHILKQMTAVLPEPRASISLYAPRITQMQISPEKIKDVIGKGGSVIRDIIEKTGVSIDIDDKGLIKIAAVGNEAAEAAKRIIMEITAEPEVGKIYEGRVVKITDFGAFVNILPSCDGLLHISQIANERIRAVSDKLTEGQIIKVKILEIDRQGKIKLSMKNLEDETDPNSK